MSSNSKEYIKRNYHRYWGNTKALRDRVKRVQARRIMIKKGLVKVGDGLEIDHKKGISGGNGPGNLRVLSRLKNRQLGQKKATKSQLRNNKL